MCRSQRSEKKEFRQQNPDAKHLRRDDLKSPCGTLNAAVLTSGSQALPIPLFLLWFDKIGMRMLSKLSKSQNHRITFDEARFFSTPMATSFFHAVRACYLLT